MTSALRTDPRFGRFDRRWVLVEEVLPDVELPHNFAVVEGALLRLVKRGARTPEFALELALDYSSGRVTWPEGLDLEAAA